MSYAIRNDKLGWRAVDGPDQVGPDEYFSDHPIQIVVPITTSSVDTERDRRMDSGLVFDGRAYQSRAADRENITGAALLATMAIVRGAKPGDLRWSDPDQDFVWIASDNSMVPMDAPTVMALGKYAAERKQQLIYAGRQLKDMDVIPSDYTDDKWWP